MSSIHSPFYALAGFPHEIQGSLAGRLESYVKNSDHFIQLLKYLNFQSLDTIVSFHAVGLVITSNVPGKEALQVIGNKLHNEHTMAEQSILQVKTIVEWLEVCLRTIYLNVDNNFFQQKDGMIMQCSLSPNVSNIFMGHFVKVALETVQNMRLLWL